MSIRIIPQDELGSSEKRTAEYIPPLLFPRLKNLYNRRAERLRELAENNPLGDFLRFAALVAHAQEVVLYDHPLQMDLTARIKEANEQGKPPLDIHVLPRDKHWHKLLHSLIAELKPEMSGTALAVIENLEKASDQELEEMASALFASDFSLVSSDKAPFIWAALSLYWAQMASLIPGKARAEYGEARQFCPVVLFSVLWSRMTRNGALAGMIIGAVTVIVWKQFAWLGLYEIIPGFIFGSLGIVVFSLLGKAPSAAMQKRFSEADAHYHSAPPSKLQAE